MAHRPCLLSVHVPSATAGMTSLYDHLRPILGCTQQAGQSHLNSDATIAHEGRPQGGEGTHKGRPYRLSSRGVLPWGGHPQGVPLPFVFSRRFALGRAPTRGAPTDCLLAAYCPGEGTHKGRPYRLSSRGILPWGGHPQGVPLPIVFSRRTALGRAPTRGAPTDCLLAAFCPWGGHPQGAPLPIVFSRHFAPWGGHPQGAPLPIVFSRLCPWGGHPQGVPLPIVFSRLCPWGGHHPQGVPLPIVFSRHFAPWGGHPHGAPLPIVFSRRLALGRAPTRGAPTDCLLAAYCPGEGTHRHPKRGRPYPIQAASRGFSNLMQLPRPSRGARWTPGIR